MRPVLTVDPDAIVANWRELARVHGAPAAAVVKADAYGLGAAIVAPRLHRAGATFFFVAQLEEGVLLRRLLPGATIAILNGFSTADAADYLAHDLAPVLGALHEIDAYRALAAREGRALPALLHIDTGMNRLGLPGHELDAVASDPGRLAGIDWLYAMTHLVSAEAADDPRNEAQRLRFAQACARLPPMKRSLANSSGIFLGEAFRSDLARPGAALYGVNPTPGLPNPMRPVMRLQAPVLQMREIGGGESVGYNAIWVAARPSRVATIALGYADGYHRAASNRARVAFDGMRLPLIGRVSMDLITIDATDAPGLAPGGMVELIGPAIPVDEVAGWAGTNGYEVLTSLRRRAGCVVGPL